MKQGSFTKEIFVQSDTKTVMNVIADYSNHHPVHPLIVNVERAKDEPPGVRRYFITDNLHWGPFKFKIRYRADILSITEDTVHTEAYQSPQTTITNVTKVTSKDGGVVLQETVTLRSPDMLFGYAFRQADVAHKEMLERIKEFIENK
jgi:hypothetical protein